MEGLTAALNRQPTEYSLIYPQFALAYSWGYEMAGNNKAGMGINLNLSAAPLIGISIKWDILELACRRHPIAYAVLKVIDGISYYLDGSIKLDFIVTGKISMDVDWQYNKLQGFKDISAKGKSAIQAEILFKASIEKEWHVWQYEVAANFGIGLKGTAGLGIINQYGLDKEGAYLQNTLKFEGFNIKATLTAKVKIKDQDDENDGLDVVESWEVEITMAKFTLDTPKFYLTKLND